MKEEERGSGILDHSFKTFGRKGQEKDRLAEGSGLSPLFFTGKDMSVLSARGEDRNERDGLNVPKTEERLRVRRRPKAQRLFSMEGKEADARKFVVSMAENGGCSG